MRYRQDCISGELLAIGTSRQSFTWQLMRSCRRDAGNVHKSKGQAKDSVVDNSSRYIQLLIGKGNIGMFFIVGHFQARLVAGHLPVVIKLIYLDIKAGDTLHKWLPFSGQPKENRWAEWK